MCRDRSTKLVCWSDGELQIIYEPMTLISEGRGSSRTVNKLPLDIIDPYNIEPYRLINR